MEDNKCGCGCHKGKGLKGIAIFLIGLTFLLANTGVLAMATANIIWPVLIMLVGAKMISKMCKCCDKAK
jgi:di/tricarboxylate transporter